VRSGVADIDTKPSQEPVAQSAKPRLADITQARQIDGMELPSVVAITVD
jgi:hypothetical protein